MGEHRRRSRWLDRIGSGAVPVVVEGVVLFAVAGRLDLPRVWLMLVLTLIGRIGVRDFVARADPELAYRRGHVGEGTPRWDRAWLAGFVLLAIAIPVVAGLDLGRSGSSMSVWLWPLGFTSFSLGLVVTAWAMVANTHFETTVRIQKDRAHAVADTGPYALVRHPGYLGAILFVASCPFMLGSWWCSLPALAACSWLVLRTLLEDRMLQRELAGYPEYAARVHARLFPGLW